MAEGDGVAIRSFKGAGGAHEHYMMIDAAPELPFAEQLAVVERRYAAATASLGLAPSSAIFRRFYVSDVVNQADRVRESPLFGTLEEGPVAVSIIQQAPLCGTKIALLAYHVSRAEPIVKRELAHNHMLVEMGGRSHLWSTRLSPAEIAPTSSAQQTRVIFAHLLDALSAQGGNLRDHCVRTWIYLKNVDVFYQGMVDARTELFRRHGLNADTHYIASTGIEGACAHRYDVVAMDAYSVLGLSPGQMSYLNDFDALCATKDYAVTFERATQVAYGDRAHIFISGTASIDSAGQVVHPGDVLAQLDRALANVEALLRAGRANLGDMTHLTVYLRDPSDYAVVRDRLAKRLPGMPMVIVQGAVCRPEWLIEVEGIAVVGAEAAGLSAF